MHPVERRRLGRAHVGADVLERVVAERDELALGREACLDLGDAARGDGARREVLEPILGPAHRDAEHPRGEPDEHDVRQHGRLDPERAARVGRRQQAQPVAAQAERRGRDAVQRERALEVRPRGEAARRLVPVADDAVALDGKAGRARHAERRAHDDVRARERVVDVAVVERALVDRLGRRDVDDCGSSGS